MVSRYLNLHILSIYEGRRPKEDGAIAKEDDGRTGRTGPSTGIPRPIANFHNYIELSTLRSSELSSARFFRSCGLRPGRTTKLFAAPARWSRLPGIGAA